MEGVEHPDGVRQLAGERGWSGRRAGALLGLTPSRELPGILVIVDECHRIWDRTTVEWWANASREWRKLLGGIFASTEVATLKEAFGGSDALRSNLCAGNGIALRTMSNV